MNIDVLRREIDGIDDRLLELFQRRMAIAKEIGQCKKEKALPVRNAEREREILSRLCETAPPELAEYVRTLFTSIFEICINYQKESATNQHEPTRT